MAEVQGMAINYFKEVLKREFETIRDETLPGANTAQRIGKAFLDLLDFVQNIDGNFLRKDVEDTAQEVITFLKGILVGDYHAGESGGKIDGDGNAELNRLLLRAEAIFRDNLSSDDFTEGFLSGKGWAIFKQRVINAAGVLEDKWTGEFDNLVVRGSLRVFEMIVCQMLGENDNRIFAAMMEVDHYEPDLGRVYFDNNDGKLYNPFRQDDCIEVAQYNGHPSEENEYYVTKNYECIIDEVFSGFENGKRVDWVTFRNFTTQMTEARTGEMLDPAELIARGDTFVRVDNLTDVNRKGIMQIISVGPNTPYLDVMYGKKTDPDHALKGRLGNLSGIYHPYWGWLSGYGEYLINLYAVGDFTIRRTGENLDAKMEMLKGLFSTQFQQQTYDLTEEDNFLFNSTFTSNMYGWTPDDNEDTAFIANGDGSPVILNGATVTSGSHRANVEDYEGRQMLHLLATGVTQRNTLIRKPGTHKEYVKPDSAVDSETTQEAKDVQDTLYLTIKFIAKTDGKLTIGFKYDGEVPEGVTNTLPYTVEMPIERDTTNWRTIRWEGTWHSLGDFYLHFSGEMYVAMLAVTDKPLDEFKHTVSTQILQTAENVLILGKNINATEGKVTALGIELRAADAEILLYVNTTTSDMEQRLGILISEGDAAVKIYAEKYAKEYVDGQLTGYYTKSEIDVTVNGINTSVIGINDTIALMLVDLNGLQEQIDAANAAIDKNKSDLEALNGYVDGAFADGIITQAEKIAIEKYLNTLESSKKDIDATYNKILDNDFLVGGSTARQGLVTAYTNLDNAYNVLVDSIQSTISDEAATTEEIADVNSKFSTYNDCISAFEQAIEVANKAIQDEILSKADNNTKKLFDEAKELIDGVKSEVDDANTALSGLRTDVYGAFKDGLLTDSEKASIRLALSQIETEGAELKDAYDKLYANEFLVTAEKAKLKTAYDNMVSYRNSLISIINTKLAKTKLDASDITDVENAFDDYSDYLAAFSAAIEVANKAIQDEIKKQMSDYVDQKVALVQQSAEQLAKEAALGEYYNQAENPYNSWTDTVAKHIGAKWRATSNSVVYKGYDATGNLVDKYTTNGGIYRFVGSAKSQNVWEEITSTAMAASFISNTKDHISAVVANFDASGNVLQKSGIVTTAYGNTLYASKNAPSSNVLFGTGTGVGWELTQGDTSVKPASFYFMESSRQFVLINKFASDWQTRSGNTYHNASLSGGVMKLESGQKYVLSFNGYQAGGATLHVQFAYGSTASNCAIVSSCTLNFDYRIDDLDAAIAEGSVTSLDNALNNNRMIRYKAHDDGGYKRYYFIFTAQNTYLKLFFTSQVQSSRTTNAYIYIRKIQVEKAVNTVNSEIFPSEYKEGQTLMESFIKQTAESIVISADRIHLEGLITANKNFKIDTEGTLYANKGVLNYCTVYGSVRSPFVTNNYQYSVTWEGETSIVTSQEANYDNLINNSGYHNIPFGVEQSGRTITIAHWEGNSGSVTYQAESGYYFYEDGVKKESITISREIVVLKGYGTSSKFLGWIVMSRTDLYTTRSYGRYARVLAMGKVVWSNSDYSLGTYITYDLSTITIEKVATGKVRVNIPADWNVESGKLVALVNAISDEDGVSGNGPMYAGISSYENTNSKVTSFVVNLADDSSRNNGSFQFVLFNMGDWDLVTKFKQRGS